MSALAMARTALRRMARDRTSLFFVVVLPVLVIVIVGTTAQGGDSFDVGVLDDSDGAFSAALVAALDADTALDIAPFDGVEALERAVRRSELAAGVIVPAGYDAALAAGGTAEVSLVVQPASSIGLAARAAVSSAVAGESARVQAARFAADATGRSLDEGFAAAERAAVDLPRVVVSTRVIDGESQFLPDGFSYSAPTMLVLFVFVNALAFGGMLIENRRLRVYERMLAAPVQPRSIVLGEFVAYLSIMLLQSLLIVVVGAALFGVDWGDPLGATALVVTWALLGTGAGLLSGTAFRTPEQASAIGPTVGMAFGMLGGCMWPLAIVPDWMRTLGHVVPHGWAIDAWTELLSRGGDLVDIAGDLAVLLAFAAGLLALSTWRLGRRLLH